MIMQIKISHQQPLPRFTCMSTATRFLLSHGGISEETQQRRTEGRRLEGHANESGGRGWRAASVNHRPPSTAMFLRRTTRLEANTSQCVCETTVYKMGFSASCQQHLKQRPTTRVNFHRVNTAHSKDWSWGSTATLHASVAWHSWRRSEQRIHL